MYVTNGSREKALNPEPLPPHQRYLSDRVWYVRQLAKDAGEDFAVISGEYGLVTDTDNVPMYDYVLPWSEVETLGKTIAKDIQSKGISSITFFVLPQEWEQGRAVTRYSAALQLACSIAKIPYAIKSIDKPLGGRTEGEPTPVRPENVEIGGPYTMNKKAEPSQYKLLAQDEKGLWQEVRKSSFLPDLQIKAKSLLKQFPDRKVDIVADVDNTSFLS